MRCSSFSQPLQLRLQSRRSITCGWATSVRAAPDECRQEAWSPTIFASNTALRRGQSPPSSTLATRRCGDEVHCDGDVRAGVYIADVVFRG